MPVPRHWFPGINCGQPLTKCTDANLGFCACFSQNSGLSLFVRLGRVEIATRGVGVSVIEGDRGGKGKKSFFVFSFPPPTPPPQPPRPPSPTSPFDSPQLVRFFAVEYGGVDTGIISADNNTRAPNVTDATRNSLNRTVNNYWMRFL